MLDAEKASRISLWVLQGMLKDYEGSLIDDEALEVVRQVIWAADNTIRAATGAYWKAREAEKPKGEPAPNGATVVALPPRGA